MEKTFCLLSHKDIGSLEDEVTEYMKLGWFPHGPVQILEQPYHTLYVVSVIFLKPAATVQHPKQPTIH